MRLALDVGGTKFAACRVDEEEVTAAGVKRDAVTAPTPESDVWDVCSDLLRTVADGHEITAVGIASAGPVDIDRGTVSPLNIPEWAHGFALVNAAQRLYPRAEIRLVLDGAAVALAEHRLGAGRGCANLLSVVVSTGVGGGLILDGRPVEGRTGNAGHVGHVVVSVGEDRCACGGVGCLESVASGPSAVRWAQKHGWNGTDGHDLARAAFDGDPVANAALDRVGSALGEAFSSVAALLDLDRVVVGGGFAQAGPVMWNALGAAVSRHAGLSFTRDLRVVPAELGPTGTLTGAAIIAAQL